MSDLTQILSRIETGDPSATEKLLPLVYDELRKLAAAKLAHESSGQTLQATALVHEAYLRLMGGTATSDWDSSGHFFAAAAEAMRRILVEGALLESHESSSQFLNVPAVEQFKSTATPTGQPTAMQPNPGAAGHDLRQDDDSDGELTMETEPPATISIAKVRCDQKLGGLLKSYRWAG